MKYIKDTKLDYENNKCLFKEMVAGKKFPVTISFKFIRGSKHKFDYINPAQTLQDQMVKYKWITDDNAEEMIPIFLEFEYNKDNPGVYINVLKS